MDLVGMAKACRSLKHLEELDIDNLTGTVLGEFAGIDFDTHDMSADPFAEPHHTLAGRFTSLTLHDHSTNTDLYEWLPRFHRLRHLEIDNDVSSIPSLLLFLDLHGSNLQYLRLSLQTSEDINRVIPSINCCEQLQYLRLHAWISNENQSGAPSRFNPQKLSKLSELHLALLKSDHNPLLYRLASSCPDLSVLYLYNCESASDVNIDSSVALLLQQCTRLRHVRMIKVGAITSLAFEGLPINGQTSLQRLEITIPDNHFEWGFQLLGSRCPNLRSLTIR